MDPTNPYRPPDGAWSDDPHDGTGQDVEIADIAAATPPFVTKAAGGVVVLAGAVVAFTAAQTLMMFEQLFPPFDLGTEAQLGLALPTIVVGAMLFRARAWAALAAIALSFALFLLSVLWLVATFAGGLFSVLALGAPVASAAAFVMSLLALGPSRRAARARQRMRERGLNLGL
jgi:hypothetical protein